MIRLAHELEVWLFEQQVGKLALVDGRLSFAYAADWLNKSGSVPLSASLPLQAQAFEDRQARPFFAGLLPEGEIRRLIAQHFQVSRQNDFALLDRIGGECAGAVSFWAPGYSLTTQNAQASVKWLTDEELAGILDELPRRPMMVGQGGMRLSLAGAQDKLPVVVDGQKIGLPQGGAPSSHILKPAIQAVHDSVINEGFCMALAQAMRLAPAQTQVREVLGRSYLLVQRYDRIVDAAGVRHRIHQEDFCQALGVVPELKYQNEGGPDLRQCFDLVRRLTRPNAPQVLRLFDYVVFNALIGNHDAHAKNFSLLRIGSELVLAPLYDVLCTAVYPRLTPKMAMKLGSKYQFDDVYARHWEQFAQGVGLSPAQAKRRILELANTMPKAARALQTEKLRGFGGAGVVEQIIAVIELRCSQTARRLKDSSADDTVGMA